MKKIILFALLFLGVISAGNLAAQADSKAAAKAVLDNFCENHFYDCFDWKYIKIVSIDNVKTLSDGNIKVTGVVRNSGYFGSVHDRDFIATLTYLGNNRMNINFNKHGITAGVGSWTDCNKNVAVE